MATNADSFPITAAMLTMAYVKPVVTFTTVAGKATTTDVYLPATVQERAGARGVGTAVTTDANWTFASTITDDAFGTIDSQPYPLAVAALTAVECTPTLVVPTVV